MANSLLTIDMITREAIKLWYNSNAFIQNINTQYDGSFAKEGAKIGTTLRIRYPNDYTVTDGPALSVQSTAEQFTTLTVSSQKHVDVSFSSVERTMQLDDYSEIVLAPMINNLAGAVASDIMSGVNGGVCNIVYNSTTGMNSSATILSPVAQTFLTAGAALTLNSAPMGSVRKIVNSPQTMARTVSTLSGLFNNASAISKQYETGQMYNALGFGWMEDPTVLGFTSGTFSAGGTVNGANQTGSTITVNAITGTLKKGDIITFAGVKAVNRITKEDTGELRQFVVTADVATSGTSISIYPALIPAVNGNKVQFQTVTASPANSAAMALVTPANTMYRKNIAFARDAITMATADLIMPGGVMEVARHQKDGISMRMLTDYLPGTDQIVTRLDVLYGFKYLRPEWAVIVADAV